MRTEQEIEAEFERIDGVKTCGYLLLEVRQQIPLPYGIHDDYQFHYITKDMCSKGFCIALANGLGGTWEATFYDPKEQSNPDYEAVSYSTGNTLGIAVCRSVLKALFYH